jgi:glycosyltransferase involved in cell wall biosynthesis
MKPGIVVIGGRWSRDNKSISQTASKLVRTLQPLTDPIICISTNHTIPIQSDNIIHIEISDLSSSANVFSYIFSIIKHQLRISKEIIHIFQHNPIKGVLFCFGADLLIVPILISKLYGKKVIIRADGKPSIYVKIMKLNKLKLYFFEGLENTIHRICDCIVLEHEYMFYYFNYNKYKYKIECIPLYVELDQFKKTVSFSNRSYDIGFIGRLSKEKGIVEFVSAINDLPDEIKCTIIGDGELKQKVLNEIPRSTQYRSWIIHSEIPQYLNDIKILIIPSYKEGLPNVMLEAMACGTVVLGTKVGAMAKIIDRDRKGFSLESNDPSIIKKLILELLKNPDLERIGEKSIEYIEDTYSYDNSVRRYENLFEKLNL